MATHHLINIAATLFLTLAAGLAPADDRPIADALRKAGATKIEQDKQGAVTSLFFRDSSTITPEQWNLIGQLAGAKQMTFYLRTTLSDETLPLLAGLTGLEAFASDGAQFSDSALATMAKWKNLRKITFFHCGNRGKTFTGSGVAAFTALPHLESLAMGGSPFNDDGMAAVGRLTGLTELRIWHTRNTPAGNVHLANLQNLTLLRYGPNACTTAEAIPQIAELHKLENLTLMETHLIAADLEPFRQLPQLKTLTLERVEISAVDLAAVKAALPKVDVKWTVPDEKAMGLIRQGFGKGR
jgi:hypothetical protein